MTPRTTSPPRPIRRVPSPRPPDLPAGMCRIKAALRCFRHQLRAGADEALALEWSDLWAERDGRRLADEVAARLARPECRRHLVGVFSPADRVGDPPGDREAAGLTPLYRPPAGAARDDRP